MRLFILTLCLGFIAGWLVLDRSIPNSNKLPDSQHLSPDHLRLLGGSSDIQVPWLSHDPFNSVHEIFAEIDSASSAQLRGWLKSLIATPTASEVALNAIIARLAALDPAGTFALLKGEDALEHHLSTVLVVWAQNDLPNAIDAAMARDNRSVLLKDLISGLDAATCETLYDVFVDRGYHLADAPVLWHLFDQLAEHDLEGTLSKAVDASLRADSTDRGIDHAITHWYREEPEAALRWVIDQEHPSARKLSMEALARVAILNDGAEGLNLVWDHLDEGQRKALLDRNLNASTEDMEGWFEWMDTHVASPRLHLDMMEGLLSSLRESDHPEKMPDILTRMTVDSTVPVPTLKIYQVSQRWAAKDLEGFQKWIKTIDIPGVRKSAERGLIDHWADTDPMKVIEFWEKSDSDEYRASTGLRSNIIDKLFDRLDVFSSDGDPQDLIDLLPESLRDEAMIPFIAGMVEESPVEAIRLLENQPQGQAHNRVMQEAVARWVSEDPGQASEWVAGMEEGDRKNKAAQNVANTWARFDLQAAQAWIGELPASESRDWAIKEYAEFAADYSPEETLSLAMTVSNERIRDELVQNTMSGVARRDPERAAELTEAIILPDALRSQIDQMIEQGRAFDASFE